MEEVKVLGHSVGYWLELNEMPRVIKAEHLIEEIVDLKGKLAFLESRVKEMQTIFKD